MGAPPCGKVQKMTDILNLSGMYDGYDLSSFGEIRFIELKDLSGTRLYIDKDSEEIIKEKIRGSHSLIHLIDTGDHHYITRLYLHNIKEAFDLLVFDNHDDSQEPVIEGMKSCGSWIRDAMSELPDTLSAVKLIQGRDRISLLKGTFDGKRPLYVSIDKDVLSPDVCPTDWDQGDMGIEDLKELLFSEGKGREIKGFDICGGVKGDGILYREEIIKNRETDLKLIAFLREMYSLC